MGGQLQTVEEALNRRVRNSPSGAQTSRRPGRPGLPGGAFAEWAPLGAEEVLGRCLLGGRQADFVVEMTLLATELQPEAFMPCWGRGASR